MILPVPGLEEHRVVLGWIIQETSGKGRKNTQENGPAKKMHHNRRNFSIPF
jgi:hypothetical protein